MSSFTKCCTDSADELERLRKHWEQIFVHSSGSCRCERGGELGSFKSPTCSCCQRFREVTLLTGDGLFQAKETLEQAIGFSGPLLRVRTSCGASLVGMQVPPDKDSKIRAALICVGGPLRGLPVASAPAAQPRRRPLVIEGRLGVLHARGGARGRSCLAPDLEQLSVDDISIDSVSDLDQAEVVPPNFLVALSSASSDDDVCVIQAMKKSVALPLLQAKRQKTIQLDGG
mmetsp:Transcript_127203/g.406727  ORF Transcript_127203/g.406727 Transcript_127203/m.406727 type:complete len:229 (-) Transcript_127203:715-1401(-)